jgi:hypothetical protein
MFAGKGQDARKLLVFHWSDGSRDPFWADKDFASFIEWKLNKWPNLSYTTESMTVSEYNAKYIFSDGQN